MIQTKEAFVSKKAKALWGRGRFPELRKFFDRNKVPVEILDGLLRNKKYHPLLPRLEIIAGLLNEPGLRKKSDA